MYSRALLLTSTVASARARRGATAHASARALPHRARRAAPPTRHSSRASASDADEKPLPCTVRGVPPSESARAGATQLAAAAGWYVNDAAAADDAAARVLLRVHRHAHRASRRPRAGDAHSSCAPSTYRASTARDRCPRQRTATRAAHARAASRPPPPTTARACRRATPRSGPSGGATPLARSSAW